MQIKSLSWQGVDKTFRKLSKQHLILSSGAVDLLRGLFICCHTGVILAPLEHPGMRYSIDKEVQKMLLLRAYGKAGKGVENNGVRTRGVSLPVGTIQHWLMSGC